ncbi:MAG: electron transport complex subunit RsxC [Clostridia bacterium]|nr:electron transport complex subunit RsxC [Clostridia bacterium]
MARSFFGGVHPKDMKYLSCDAPITVFPTPKTVTIPMSQHIGAPCKPLVKVGDHVLLGQKIGDNQGLCVPVHASVSGTVKAIEDLPHTNGINMLAIVIENDFEDALDPSVSPRENVDSLSAEQLMDIIREAGIAGMGGATFPAHAKLSSGLQKVDTVIVNAAECEPYITADDRLMREMPEKIIKGLRVVMKIFGLSNAYIGMEDNKPEAAASLKKAIGDDITLCVLHTRYPQGAEKQMIQSITGRQVPPGGLPAAVGCAVFNCATCAAICDAVYDGLPLVRRVVTVTGRAIETPKNYLVPIGTSFRELIDSCGLKEAAYKVLSGGPMMGFTQYDLSVPVIKGTNAVTVFSQKDRVAEKNPHCIRCGRCVDTCPMNLMPLNLYKAERQNDTEALDKLHIMDCIECGCCAYGCPAGIPLVQSFRSAKQKLRNEQQKQKEAVK